LAELEAYKGRKKPKFGKPKELANYILADLVVRGYIEQKISLTVLRQMHKLCQQICL
ncbi:9701_t:CDS:1, partial [Funneliformis geosporum]